MTNERVQFSEFECPSPEIAAYIDGELSSERELELEFHLIGCDLCSAELNAQKLFLCALDSSLQAEPEIEAALFDTLGEFNEVHVDKNLCCLKIT